MLERKILACGTMCPDRPGLPSHTKGMNHSDAEFKKCHDLAFVHWKDKWDVFCLSTFHSTKMEPTVTRRREDVQRPVLT